MANKEITEGMIYQKIPVIMDAVGAISKSRKNTMQNYSFRGIDDIYNAFNSELSKNKVFCTPEILEHSREERASKNGGVLIYTIVKMKFKFYAEDGSSIETTTIGEAMDSGDKSANKAMSSAQKYAFIQLFCIPTEENNDTENETHEVAPKQVKTINKIKEVTPPLTVEKPGMELMDTLDEWIQKAADTEKRTVAEVSKSLKDKFDLEDKEVVEKVIKLLETKYND